MLCRVAQFRNFTLQTCHSPLQSEENSTIVFSALPQLVCFSIATQGYTATQKDFPKAASEECLLDHKCEENTILSKMLSRLQSHNDIKYHVTVTPVDITSHYKEEWLMASVVNHTIVTDPTIQQPAKVMFST